MPKILFIALVAISSSVSFSAYAQFIDARQIDYPRDGVVLGNGWSSLKASKTSGGCVEFQEVADLAEDRVLDLSRILDKEQLNQEIQVSVEFQAKAIGGAGGSAKAYFSKEVETRNEALNLVMVGRVQQGARFATAPAGKTGIKLSSKALKLLKTGLPQFLNVCGDGFVAAIHSGGEMNAILTFDLASALEKEAVSSSITGGGMAWSGSASLNQAMKQYRESQRLKIFMYAAGGTGVPIPVNEEELLDRLRNLPSDAKTAPKPYTISIGRYDSLSNWPSDKQIAAVKFAEMEELVGQYQRFNSLYFDLYRMLQKPEDYIYYGNITIDNTRAIQDKLRKVHLPQIQKRIQECLNGGLCKIEEQDKLLDYEFRFQLPVRRGSFSADTQLRDLYAKRDTVEATINSEPDTLPLIVPLYDPLGSGGSATLQIPNPKKSKAVQQKQGLDLNINSVAATYPSALAEALFKEWIETPSFLRCQRNPTGEYCLSQEALKSYKTRILALLQPNIGAVDTTRPCIPWC